MKAHSEYSEFSFTEAGLFAAHSTGSNVSSGNVHVVGVVQ